MTIICDEMQKEALIDVIAHSNIAFLVGAIVMVIVASACAPRLSGLIQKQRVKNETLRR